jgi:hypothetical protein
MNTPFFHIHSRIRTKHMAMTDNETIGFCESLVEFMKTNMTTLQSSGLNVESWITEVGNLKSQAVTDNNEQEALKARLREKTKVTEMSVKTAYNTASTRLDAIIGTLGKTTELGIIQKTLQLL